VQGFLPRCVFFVMELSLVSLHSYPWKGFGWSDIKIGSKEKNRVRTFAAQETRLQNYLSGRSFSPVPVKYEHFIYINPYWNALDIVNIHRMLVFRKAKGGETWKKIPSEILDREDRDVRTSCRSTPYWVRASEVLTTLTVVSKISGMWRHVVWYKYIAGLLVNFYQTTRSHTADGSTYYLSSLPQCT
jgi:hypothetical protein